MISKICRSLAAALAGAGASLGEVLVADLGFVSALRDVFAATISV